MISNAKIRINLKEAKENTEKSLTKLRKDWEIRIFKGFLYKYGTRTKSTFSGKSQGDFTQIYALPKINQNEFDTLTLWTPCSLNLVSYQEIECEEKKDGGEDADEVRGEGLAL